MLGVDCAPTGHPDTLDKWTQAGSLNRRVGIPRKRTTIGFAIATAICSAEPEESTADCATLWAARITPNASGIAKALHLDASPIANLSPEDRNAIATAAMDLAALTPSFLLR